MWLWYFILISLFFPTKRKHMNVHPLYPEPEEGNRPFWVALAFRNIQIVVGLLAAVLFVASIGYGRWKINEKNFTSEPMIVNASAKVTDGDTLSIHAVYSEGSKTLTCIGRCKVCILLFWIVVPPIWFWYEHVGLYRYDPHQGREDEKQFKYTQDLASKIWLALVTALTILYFGKDIRT